MTADCRTGGEILADQLLIHGVDTVFAVPGESYLPVLDAFFDRRDALRLITCRHEAGAANMAEAAGKLTGRPGVCLVTRGPGACHASVGVHTAHQDSTPMLLLVGQVARDTRGREAFQEIDVRDMFQAPMAKWAVEIEDTGRLPELLHAAFRTATSGRPGPVVVGLPEDMLQEAAQVGDAGTWTPARAHPAPTDVARAHRLLAEAERPLLIAGGSNWTPAGREALATLAEVADAPVAVSFRRQDLVDNEHLHYAGDLSTSVDPRLVERVKDATLLLVLGARLGEMTTGGYATLRPGRQLVPLVHVHPDPFELGRVFIPDLAVAADPGAFAAALADRDFPAGPARQAWREAAHSDYLRASTPEPYAADLDMGQVMLHLRATMPSDTVITVDAGNFSGWAQRFWRFRHPRSQLGPTSGAMGYSVPAGVAASILAPEREVVSFVGDGGFLMSGQELATAAQHGARPLVLIVNNSMYGTIRMHQERSYPGRTIGTDLKNPDFAVLAKVYGAHGERVTRTDQFPDALGRARASGTAAVIELVVDPDQITTRTTLAQLHGTETGDSGPNSRQPGT